MDATRRILEAVARADLIVCAAARVAVVVGLLALVLLLVVLAARPPAADPYFVDYDAQGVDITSEGPEGYTEEWNEWRDGE